MKSTLAALNTIFKSALQLTPGQGTFLPQLERTRIVPSMKTFYARNPYHEENMAALQTILNKHAVLPFDRKSSSESTSWLKFKQYREKAGGDLLKETEYTQLITLLKRLDAIDVELRSNDLNTILAQYQRKSSANAQQREVKTLDQFGRAITIGRRKASSAKIYLVKGTGETLVNGKPLHTLFPKLADRQKLLLPLQLTNSEGSYNIFGLVRGGGSTGQIEALQLALSRALLIHNPLLKQRLSQQGMLHRDPRSVERKKPGKLKARKMPTWVKR